MLTSTHRVTYFRSYSTSAIFGLAIPQAYYKIIIQYLQEGPLKMEGPPAGLGIIDWYRQAAILLTAGEMTATFGINNIYAQILILVSGGQ